MNPKKKEEERTKTERDQEEHENVNTEKTKRLVAFLKQKGTLVSPHRRLLI
jgi:hypothetical protein